MRATDVDSPDRDVRLGQLREHVRASLWILPAAVVVAMAAAALALLAVDDGLETRPPYSFAGDADSARDLVSTIATATLTMTSLVLSVTIVALQLASQQFSPRVMRTFFRDNGTKLALGIFLGTFIYALVVLRAVEPGRTPDDEFVPSLAITGAFLAMLGSLATFVYFVNHVAQSIRVTNIIHAVAAETRAAIRAVAGLGTEPDGSALPERPPDLVVHADLPPGVLSALNVGGLVRVATQQRFVVRLRAHVGDYLPSGVPVFDVWSDDGAPPRVEPRQLLVHLGLGRERTMEQDIGFGFRQLVDMAEKALSPAINDPTTAVQAIDRMHDLLRRLAGVELPTGVHHDAGGALRLVTPARTWGDYLAMAVGEVLRYGRDSVQIHRRLRAMLADLGGVVAGAAERLEAVAQYQAMLDRAADRAFPDPLERGLAGRPDAQGMGGGGAG